MTPRASFVIPAFNAQPWISKAILSCRNQTVKQIEIIVVNDGSEDDTEKIVLAHINGSEQTGKPDSRVKLINQENKGRSEARNVGNSAATSEIILVLDADDMAMRSRVKDTLAFFDARKPDVVWGAFFVIDAHGHTGQKIGSAEFNPEASRLNFICHSTMAYRKGVTLNVQYEGGEFSKLGLDDWKFQRDCHKRGYLMRHIKTPLSYYRQTKGGAMGTRDEKEVERVKDAYLNVAV